MDPVTEFSIDCDREIEKQGSSDQFRVLTTKWFEFANSLKYSYHFRALGRPIIQYPQDMIAVQNLIWQVQPDLIIETGIAHGGSLVQSASMLALIDYCDAARIGAELKPGTSKRKVIGIDIDIREHNKKAILEHPMAGLIDLIQGSSTDVKVIEQVRRHAANSNKVMVILDSNHTHEHVYAELNAYADLVSKGSYCIVFDTVIEDLPDESHGNRPWAKGNSPKTAVEQFLAENPWKSRFEIDRSIEHSLMITVAPSGYLRRVG